MQEQLVDKSNVDMESYVKVGDLVTKVVHVEGKQTFKGFFKVKHITFTGTEDVATIQNVLTGQVQCVDAHMLKIISEDAIDVEKAHDNIVPFKKR